MEHIDALRGPAPEVADRMRTKFKGPILQRRSQVDHGTTDQRLLDSRGADRLGAHRPVAGAADAGRVRRGLRRARRARPGDRRLRLGPARPPTSPSYAAAETIGRRLVEEGFAVITGGGPGAMEAANKGASEAGGVSVGLGIELPWESGLNEWVDVGVNFRYFFARKTMFVKYSQGFVVLPGGVRHPRRAVRGADARADRQDHRLPDRAGRHVVLAGPARLDARHRARRGHDPPGRPGPAGPHRRRRRGRRADGRRRGRGIAS